MKRTVRIADIVAAVGGIVLLVSSFLAHFGKGTYTAWHQLLINQLVVTDLIGLVVGVAAILVSLRVLPELIRTWLAPVAAMVLISAIFNAVSSSQTISFIATEAGRKSPGIGIGFILAIIGAVVLVAGTALAWLPVLSTSLGGTKTETTVDIGYQGPTTFPGAPGQPASADFGGSPQPVYGSQGPGGAFGATPPPRTQEPANPWTTSTPSQPSAWAQPNPSAPVAEPAPWAPSPPVASSPSEPRHPEATAAPEPVSNPDPAPWPQSSPGPAKSEPAPSSTPSSPSPEPAGTWQAAPPAQSQPTPQPQPQPAWGEQQAAPPPAAAFTPFWAAVPTSRTVYNPDQSGSPVGYVQPGTWYAVVGQHASGGLIVQLPTGGHGVLVETDDLIRG